MRHVWCFVLPARGVPYMKVFEDNQGVVQLAQKPMTNSNSEYVDVRRHPLNVYVFLRLYCGHSCSFGISAKAREVVLYQHTIQRTSDGLDGLGS